MKVDFENNGKTNVRLSVEQKEVIRNSVNIKKVKDQIKEINKCNKSTVNLSIEQIKMIRNAIDLKEVKKMVEEDNYNFRRFCLTEDYPTSLYSNDIEKAIQIFMKIWSVE